MGAELVRRATGESLEFLREQRETVEREADRGHQLKVREADIRLREAADRVKIELEGLKGKQALEKDLPGEATKRFQEAVAPFDEEESSLPPRTQEAVRLLRESYGSQLRSFGLAHQSREKDAYEEEVFRAHIGGLFTSASQPANRGEPAYLDLLINEGLDSIYAYAQSTGKSKEWRDAQETEFRSGIHKTILGGLITGGQDKAAREYFDRNADQLTAQDRASLQARVEEGTYLGAAQRLVDHIFLVHPEVTLGDGLELVRAGVKDQGDDPELRRRAEHEFKQRFGDKQLAKKLEDEQLADKFLRAIDQGSFAGSAELRTTRSFHELPHDVQTALTKYADMRTKPDTDWLVYHELKLLDPEAFLKQNLYSYRPVLGDAEFKELVSLQAKLRSKDAALARELVNTGRTNAQIIDSVLYDNGYPREYPSQNEKKEMDLLREQIWRKIPEEQAEKKRKLNEPDLKELAQRVIGTKVYIDRFFLFGDTEERAVLVTRDERGNAYVPLDKIDRREVEALKNELRSRGISVTDEKVERLHAADLLIDLGLEDNKLREKILSEP